MFNFQASSQLASNITASCSYGIYHFFLFSLITQYADVDSGMTQVIAQINSG
jgi:hypothetical protein